MINVALESRSEFNQLLSEKLSSSFRFNLLNKRIVRDKDMHFMLTYWTSGTCSYQVLQLSTKKKHIYCLVCYKNVSHEEQQRRTTGVGDRK